MKSRLAKRPPVTTSTNSAECPFNITTSEQPVKDVSNTKSRNTKSHGSVWRKQNSTFFSSDEFGKHKATDIFYTVGPWDKWNALTRYSTFRLNGRSYALGDFVFVIGNSTIESHVASNERWVAKILEIRASDEFHVYVRVFWMYSPDDLPRGRKHNHRSNELVGSNHMDVINAISIDGLAAVHYHGTLDDKVSSALFWRMALDCRTGAVSGC